MKKRESLIFIFFLFASIVIAQRLLTENKLYASLDDISNLKILLEDKKISKNKLKEEKDKLISKIKSKYSKSNDVSQDKENLLKERDKFKNRAGFTDLEGEGVVVVLDDGLRDLIKGEDPNQLVVHDIDVRFIVNTLRAYGAEAIAVNGKRIIVGLSEIACNGPTIRINGIQQSRPYVITAIGDRFALLRQLSEPNSYGVQLMQMGIKYNVFTKVKLKIPAYNYEGKFNYAKPKEE